MEQVGWRVLNGELAFLTGLKGEMGKSNVMVGSSGGKIIVNSGKCSVVSVEKECRQTLLCIG